MFEMNLIPAAEARKIVDTAATSTAVTQLAEIASQIETAVSNGRYAMSLNFTPQDGVIAKLKSLGYDYKMTSFRNEIDITISW